MLKVDSADILVAEADGVIAGSAVLLNRAGTGLTRLYSLAVDPALRGRGVARRLLAACEETTLARGRIVLRLEVRRDNAATCTLYVGAGYRPCGSVPDYYEDGETALRYEKLLHDADLKRSGMPYYNQSTEFTCGPACLAMALKHFDPAIDLDETLELRLWREATAIYLASGFGGCSPYGLAVAAAKRGLGVEIRLNTDEFLFLNSVRDPEKQRVMTIVQQDYRNEAEALGIPVGHKLLGARALAKAIGNGAVAIVLISGYQMFGRREPHWVIVHAADPGHLVIHDPWLEYEGFESATDSSSLPIPDAAFDRMAPLGPRGGRPGSDPSQKGCLMAAWVILVDHAKDFSNAETPHKVMTVREYITSPRLFRGAHPTIVNLSRSYTYQGAGYYASLLAAARGHRVIPNVETMVDLSRKTL